jgi:Mg2+ and Co2+ transporter CorA
MNPNLLPSRGVSLENINEEAEWHEDIEAPLSSQLSDSTSYARTLGSPRSARRLRRQRSDFLSRSRLASFDDADDVIAVSPLAGPEEWENSRADVNMPPNFTMLDVDLSPRGLEKNMRDLLTDAKYWVKLVERLGYDRKVYDADYVPNLDQLSRYYDSSDLGLLRVFHLFDSDKDRLMSRSEVIRGLVQQGLVTDPEAARPACEELFALCSENGEEVSPLEFLLALKALRLAAILHPFYLLAESRRNVIASREMDMHFHEYREDTIKVFRPLANPIDFIFSIDELPTDPKSKVQWIHSHEPNKRTVLALAVQLGLDPRYVLDVFTLWREQAKADRVLDLHGMLPSHFRKNDSTEWVFLVIPVVRLTQRSKDALEPFFQWRRQRQQNRQIGRDSGAQEKRTSLPPDWPSVQIEVESCNMAIFVTGKEGRGTVLTFTSEWIGLCKLDVENDLVIDEETLEPKIPAKKQSIQLDRLDSDLAYKQIKHGSPTATVNDSDLDMFPKVLKLLDTSYSHLRTGDPFTLVLKILSDCCEDYVKVVDAYEAAIEALSKKLKIQRDRLSQVDVRQIQRSSRHLSQIHRIVRPVTGIIDILLSKQPEWGGESTLYVSDLSANVSRCLEDTVALAESADLMKKQHQQMGKLRIGSVLYLLTLVTAVFEPAVFIVTLYGMNFKVPGDWSKFAMPEFSWPLGYLYVWGLLVAVAVIVFAYYRSQNWI